MPPSACPEASTPSNTPQCSKRAMSDAESAPQDPKKARRNSSVEPHARRDSNRDTRRRRKKKKKTPVVGIGAAKNEAAQTRPDDRSRPPLLARNEIIRFSSTPPEDDLPTSIISAAKGSSPAPSSKPLSQIRESSSQTLDDTAQDGNEAMPSIARDTKHVVPVDASVPGPEPPSSSLQDKITRLEAELKAKANVIVSHQALLSQVQQAVTCQVCLDLMYKPYALAPCGHLACHSCLVSWFTAPPADNRPAPPAIMRKKTCPHCRAVVRERPIEVWGVKGIAQAMGRSELLPNQSSVPVPIEASEGLDANADPWKDIFPKPGATARHGLPWFFPGADVDEDDIHVNDIAPRGEDLGMLDMEDGGIYRCLDCMHEIWDGVCSNCGRFYPGHRHEGDDNDDEGEPVGWLDDHMGAEEVDMADDPGWMGLEDGETDDDGDIDDWRPFAPWRRHFNMFRGPWGFFGTIHVDEEDEEDEEDMYGRADDLRVPDEAEDGEDEGYESSFIDDDDEGGRLADLVDGPRIYEVGDDAGDEDYRPNRRPRIVELASDDHEENEQEEFDVPEPRRIGRRQALLVVSSDEEAEEDVVSPGHRAHSGLRRRGRGIVESDGSDAYRSDD